MAAISMALVKELRERTGLGIMDCKKALQESDGDLDLAIDELRKKSAVKSEKLAGRTSAEGLLGLKVAPDGKKGALVEVNIETDFAARNEKFQAFVGAVAERVFATGETDVDALLAGELGTAREALVQEIGENVSVRRAVTYSAPDGLVAGYLHLDNRKGALVHLSGGDTALGRDVAMHVTAADPRARVVTSAELPAAEVEKEREIYAAQAADSGKPPEIVAKMVEGRLRKWMAEVSLVDQPFIKDGDVKIGKLLGNAGASCSAFARLEVGEGIEKKDEDFAAEVAKQLQ